MKDFLVQIFVFVYHHNMNPHREMNNQFFQK